MEVFSMKIVFSTNLRKFSASKVSRYMHLVLHVHVGLDGTKLECLHMKTFSMLYPMLLLFHCEFITSRTRTPRHREPD